MTETSRYNYERRIKRLEAENENLRDYRRVARFIYDTTVDCVVKETGISKGWILAQFKDVMK